MMILRHLLSVLLLPFMVVIVVPRWLRGLSDSHTHWLRGTIGEWPLHVGAVALFLAGLALFLWCIALFATAGKGTLAPWDPTKRLVAVGPYRHVRNPMITGVGAMLGGQALVYSSWMLVAWFAGFIVVNHLYFLISEEPGLERRFGADYARYKAAVPRWIPSIKPWTET